jgi:hypothetical protein
VALVERRFTADALELAVSAIGGFPYLLQVVGYEAWECARSAAVITVAHVRRAAAFDKFTQKVTLLAAQPLSPGDRRFLAAMAVDPPGTPSKLQDIAGRLGVDGNYAQRYRGRLLATGFIRQAGHGHVEFAFPGVRHYIANAPPPRRRRERSSSRTDPHRTVTLTTADCPVRAGLLARVALDATRARSCPRGPCAVTSTGRSDGVDRPNSNVEACSAMSQLASSSFNAAARRSCCRPCLWRGCPDRPCDASRLRRDPPHPEKHGRPGGGPARPARPVVRTDQHRAAAARLLATFARARSGVVGSDESS